MGHIPSQSMHGGFDANGDINAVLNSTSTGSCLEGWVGLGLCGELRPRVQTLTLVYIIFDNKGDRFVNLSEWIIHLFSLFFTY